MAKNDAAQPTAGEPAIEQEAVQAEPQADAPAADESAAEPEIDPALVKLNAKPIPMCHPDGGTCDLYKHDKAGNILVPASEAALMTEHGFIVVDEA